MLHARGMSLRSIRFTRSALLVVGATVLSACGGGGQSGSKQDTEGPSAPATAKPAGPTSLTLGAYTTPREAYGKAILPAFRKQLLAKSGRDVQFRESYLGSGAQARAIAGGFEADIAALSLEPDIETLRTAGLIKTDWKAGEHGGMVTRSIVVIGVRKGNPKGIHDWDDLARKGVDVLTPDARTSGGAMWNVAAIYGAAIRGQTRAKAQDKQAAAQLVGAVLRNVKALDRGARESLLNFERGLGDAIVTYENEILVGRSKGQDYDYVIPKSTILIENPVAVVDSYAQRHGSSELAKSFVDFLSTPEAQRAFAEYGLRPVLPAVATEVAARFPAVTDLFTIRDLGGWPEVQRSVFEPGAAYDRALALARQEPP